jgi:hypothetical protein
MDKSKVYLILFQIKFRSYVPFIWTRTSSGFHKWAVTCGLLFMTIVDLQFEPLCNHRHVWGSADLRVGN